MTILEKVTQNIETLKTLDYSGLNHALFHGDGLTNKTGNLKEGVEL